MVICSQGCLAPKKDSVVVTECNTSIEAEDIVITPSWTWLDITVGVSTRQDVLAKFGKPESINHWSTEKIEGICRYRYLLDGKRVVFWLNQDKVIGIEFLTPTYQLQVSGQAARVNDAVTLYGYPDMVGWGRATSYRTIIWMSKGVLAEVILVHETEKSLVSNIIYFSPMNETEFTNSVWAEFIRDMRPESDSDSIDAWSENPFGWQP